MGNYRYRFVVQITSTVREKAMQIAVRSTYTAGVALIGAGVIAMSPVSPPTMTSLQLPAVQSSAVQLAAATNPITQWEQIVTEALQNTKTLVAGVFADPAPVLGQIVKNEISNFGTLGGALKDFMTAFVGQLGDVPAGLRTGLTQVFTGHISDGFQTLFQTVLTPIMVPIITVPDFLTDIQGFFAKPVQNLVNVITAAITPASGMGWVLTAGFPVISVMADMVAATGDSLQLVLDSVKSGNLVGALGAILAIPGTITGALLNGYQIEGGGLLGPNGFFQGLRNALKVIATAITPTATPPVAATGVAATSVAAEKISATKAESTKIAAAATGITLSADDTAAAVGKTEVKIETATETAIDPVTDTKTEVVVVAPTEKTVEKQVVVTTPDAADTTVAVTDATESQTAPSAKADREKRGSHQKSSTREGASSKRDRGGAKSSSKSAAGSRARAHHSRHGAGGGSE